MTREAAERLVVGDVVAWDGDAGDLGDVIEVGYCCVKVCWRNEPADRNVGLLHVSDMGNIEPFTLREIVRAFDADREDRLRQEGIIGGRYDDREQYAALLASDEDMAEAERQAEEVAESKAAALHANSIVPQKPRRRQ